MLKNIIKKILNPAFETLFSRTMSSAHQSKMEDKKLSEIYAPVKLQPPRHSLVWPTLKKAIPPSAPPGQILTRPVTDESLWGTLRETIGRALMNAD